MIEWFDDLATGMRCKSDEVQRQPQLSWPEDGGAL